MVKKSRDAKRAQLRSDAQTKRTTLALPSGQAILFYAAVALAAAIFVYQASQLIFTQDDAYISYRYAQNALNGDGLVFNIGERVEGYTNFFWVILLILGGKLGFDFDSVAKVLGVSAAVGLIALVGIWLRSAWRELGWGEGALPAAGAVLLLSANGSMVYWSISGLETVWFALFATLGVWAWVRKSWIVAPALTIASLSRPEGVFIWGMLVVAELVLGDGWKRSAILAGSAAVLLAPFAIFKVLYYGSLFPNPFYAKTGFGWEYVQSGLDYSGVYLMQFGVYGLVALLIAVAVFVLPSRWRAIPLIWLGYAVYITLIGGDVLKVHRFFVPITSLLAVSITVSLFAIVRRVQSQTHAIWITPALLIALAVSWYYVPLESITYFRNMELGLVQKMTVVGSRLKQYDSSNFSLAVSTIGKISYDLMGHRVIDMLGLTDSTIARHPERIEGNVSSWRERKFNASYLLGEAPTYILFSTGHKPSAPAERALILHKSFRRNYFTTIYPSPEIRRNLAVHVWKGGYDGPDSVWPDIEWVQDINLAWNLTMNGASDSAVAVMKQVKAQGPGDYAMPDYFLADQLYRLGRSEAARAYADSALATDSMAVVAWQTKGMIDQANGDTAALRIDLDYLSRVAPQILEAGATK